METESVLVKNEHGRLEWKVQQVCCAVKQIVIDMSVLKPKEFIMDRMYTMRKQHGYTTFTIVLMVPGENKLIPVLEELGFKPILQFHRRSRYDQDQELRMFFIEPEWVGEKPVVGKNKMQVL